MTISLAALEAALARRGLAVPETAAVFVGHELAVLLSEAHAAVDAEGDLAPIALGRWSAGDVLFDGEGYVSLAEDVERGPQHEPPRVTPRADVHLLGLLLARLIDHPDDELSRALDLALEPVEARRRITAVEVEAILARGLVVPEGRTELVELMEIASREDPPTRVASPDARALSPLTRVGVALATAMVVYGAGVVIIDRWLR